MVYLYHLVKPACVGALAGLLASAWLGVSWSSFTGLAVFYLMLVVRERETPPGGGRSRD
jgi:hypothetical protein